MYITNQLIRINMIFVFFDTSGRNVEIEVSGVTSQTSLVRTSFLYKGVVTMLLFSLLVAFIPLLLVCAYFTVVFFHQ